MSDFTPPESPTEPRCPLPDEATSDPPPDSDGSEGTNDPWCKPRDVGVKVPMNYGADESGLYLIKRGTRTIGSGAEAREVTQETKVRLTNFLAFITGQEILDDGEGDEKVRRKYHIMASRSGAGFGFTIPADQFFDMRRWVDTYVGAPATVLPNVQNYLDHAAAAIKILSGVPPTVHVRTHTGWTGTAGATGFLHQGGTIGSTSSGRLDAVKADAHHDEWPTATHVAGNTFGSPGPSGPFSGAGHGPITYQTHLHRALQKFHLPPPLTGDDLKAGFKAVYELVKAASPAVGFSLLGLCFGAPLGGSKTYVNLIGGTDSGKSVYAGLWQSFYGPEMNGKNLPAHWGASGNFLERLLYHAKGRDDRHRRLSDEGTIERRPASAGQGRPGAQGVVQ